MKKETVVLSLKKFKRPRELENPEKTFELPLCDKTKNIYVEVYLLFAYSLVQWYSNLLLLYTMDRL